MHILVHCILRPIWVFTSPL